LLDAGALSVDLADRDAETLSESPLYGEPGSDVAAAWPATRLTALFGAQEALDRALVDVVAAMGPLPPHVVLDVPEQDWVRATQAQFGPIRIDERLWIIPSWSAVVDSDAVNLVLDPGLAFGTGSHPTTRLCLAWLSATLPAGATVLDYGCGSGILAIAAARLGAGHVVGTDIDPQAIVASRDNAARNGVAAQFFGADALPSERVFDVVVANILANPLIVLAPALAHRVVPGGRILLSGILVAQAAEVQEAYGPWFRIAPWKEEDGWVALEGTRLR
jgi:ribosomal protein L11 methyltransferase